MVPFRLVIVLSAFDARARVTHQLIHLCLGVLKFVHLYLEINHFSPRFVSLSRNAGVLHSNPNQLQKQNIDTDFYLCV